ncbi:hypothetical protein J5I95_22810 [Candidatus Poribacteria bacterium]|nr:hypothetical protein [Candidatus Poribacteria bacterium]
MANTLPFKFFPFQMSKFNTNLLSGISLIVLCTMIFLLMSSVVKAHNTNDPDCGALQQTVQDKMNAVAFATGAAATAGIAASVACGVTIKGLFLPPVAVTAGLACIGALASFGAAIWWVDVKKGEFDRALAHYNEHCPPIASGGCDSGSCSG